MVGFNMILQNIPKYIIDASYYEYVMVYYGDCMREIKESYGDIETVMGLTPDVVKQDVHYIYYKRLYDLNFKISKTFVPKAAELKKIRSSYSEKYDYGQRIEINKHFGRFYSGLIAFHDGVISLEYYNQLLEKHFEGFEV